MAYVAPFVCCFTVAEGVENYIVIVVGLRGGLRSTLNARRPNARPVTGVRMSIGNMSKQLARFTLNLTLL